MNRQSPSQPGRQRGIAAVEFALTSLILFTFLYGVMEVARISFVWNTLAQATTRLARAAANVPFGTAGSDQLNTLRKNVIFVSNDTDLMAMTNNITIQNLLVDYLDPSRTPIKDTDLPSCQADNLTRCAADPNSKLCVRYVRVRVCTTGSDSSTCNNVPYHSFTLPVDLNIQMPPFTAIVPLEASTIPGVCP
jgi:Flp pilus assembly protein TadG